MLVQSMCSKYAAQVKPFATGASRLLFSFPWMERASAGFAKRQLSRAATRLVLVLGEKTAGDPWNEGKNRGHENIWIMKKCF